MVGRGTTAAALAGLAALAAIASCGPSFRRTAESDNAFVRCFDLDYRPGTPAAEKTECWGGWLDDHVYNQPEDKIAYARVRLGELARGVSVPGPPGPPGRFDRRPERLEVEGSPEGPGSPGEASGKEPGALPDAGLAP